MKKIILFSLLFIALFFVTAIVNAADVEIFDSTNHYLGACQMTNKSEWELKEDINITKFQIWYNWGQGETSVPVKLLKDGEKFAEFDVTRSQCDPYQKQWCNGDYIINKLFPKGTYTTEIPENKQCLKPGGTGAIRLYKDDSTAKKEEPTPTVSTMQPTTVITQAVPQQQTGCSCNQTTILVTAAVTSIVTSVLIALILRR